MPKPGPRTTYKYSEEFKATAVKLSRLPGVAIKDVAAELKALRRMKKLTISPAQTWFGAATSNARSSRFGIFTCG